MPARRWLPVFVVAIAAAVFGYAGFKTYRGSQIDSCYACARPIHAGMRTAGIVNGRARAFCCPACALSEHEQEGMPVRILSLTSFLTGEKLTPGETFIVKGSDVNMCVRTHELMDSERGPAALCYDRCQPGMLAFKGRRQAQEFASRHGGQVLPFADIASQYTH